MKKISLFFLCFAVFVLAVGGCFAYFYFTPRGILREDTPAGVMQSYVDSMGDAAWRSEFVRLAPVETTPFEDGAVVAGELFDAVPAGGYSFRESLAEDSAAEYIISRGETDLFLARTEYQNGAWGAPVLTAADHLSAQTRTLTVTVPESSEVRVNGVPLGTEYIAEANVPYADMTELESRFTDAPHRVRYAVDGLYKNAQVEVSREGGVLLLSGGMTDWDYTLPEGGCHSFRVTAPSDAVVTVNGAALTGADAAASAVMPTALDIPAELASLLPTYTVYTAGGLYSVPSISAVLPDGTALTPTEESDGSISFSLPGSGDGYDAAGERAAGFLRALLHYGAGHTAEYDPFAYLASGSELNAYCSRARSSLHWTVGVTLNIENVTVGSFIPLGDSALLCSAHADYSTETRHETKTFSQDYEMLLLREGEVWRVYDLAFC